MFPVIFLVYFRYYKVTQMSDPKKMLWTNQQKSK